MSEEHLRRISELAHAKQEALEMGGAAAVERQRARATLTCRERIDRLFNGIL